MAEQEITYPTESKVQHKVLNGIKRLLDHDRYLLEQDVNERSISHRLSSYLQDEFGEEWDVDCEYNREYENRKKLNLSLEPVTPDDLTATTVFPDIIVHRRGRNQNLLVIEMKKTKNLREREVNFDLQKLLAFKQEGYRYCHTFYLQLKTENDIGIDKMQWDGKWITSEDQPLGSLLVRYD